MDLFNLCLGPELFPENNLWSTYIYIPSGNCFNFIFSGNNFPESLFLFTFYGYTISGKHIILSGKQINSFIYSLYSFRKLFLFNFILFRK